MTTEALGVWGCSPQKQDPPCAQFAREKETFEIKRRRRTTDTPNTSSKGCVKIVQKPIFLIHDRKWSQQSRVRPLDEVEAKFIYLLPTRRIKAVLFLLGSMVLV